MSTLRLLTRRWHDASARRLAAVMRWPQRCNDAGERESLATTKLLFHGEAMWLIRARIERSLVMTANAISRGHQR